MPAAARDQAVLSNGDAVTGRIEALVDGNLNVTEPDGKRRAIPEGELRLIFFDIERPSPSDALKPSYLKTWGLAPLRRGFSSLCRLPASPVLVTVGGAPRRARGSSSSCDGDGALSPCFACSLEPP